MVIEVGRFKLVGTEDRFNLLELKKVENKDFASKKKTGEISEREIEVGYDMRFETCIRYILDRTLNDQDLKVDLHTYVEMYKKEREKLMNILK